MLLLGFIRQAQPWQQEQIQWRKCRSSLGQSRRLSKQQRDLSTLEDVGAVVDAAFITMPPLWCQHCSSDRMERITSSGVSPLKEWARCTQISLKLLNKLTISAAWCLQNMVLNKMVWHRLQCIVMTSLGSITTSYSPACTCSAHYRSWLQAVLLRFPQVKASKPPSWIWGKFPLVIL